MGTQPAGRTRAPVTAATKGPVARTAGPVGRFAAELGGMCAVMCLGGTIVTFAAFTAAGWLGYRGLARQAPGLSALIIVACLAVPMAAYMAVRDHRRRRNLVMTGTTIGAGVVMAALLGSDVIPTVGVQAWHGLFMRVCGPACLLMIAEMPISSGTYSGQARHPTLSGVTPPGGAQPPLPPHTRRANLNSR
jgi:hypothetical protein